jgi:hypothetical protein
MKNMKVLVMIVLFLAMISLGYGWFSFNETGEGFEGSGDGDGQKALAPASSLDAYIAEGAGYFLKSQSNFLLFLAKLETSELTHLNYVDLQEILLESKVNLELSKESYKLLVEIAEKTPYNNILLEQLQQFDYHKFEKNTGLNSVIFRSIAGFLKKGDIRGAYKHNYNSITTLLEKIGSIKSTIDSGLTPKLSDLWRINQSYSEIILFGQYATEVVFNILGGNE